MLELYVTVQIYSLIFNAESNGHSLKVVKRGEVYDVIDSETWNQKSFWLKTPNSCQKLPHSWKKEKKTKN